MSNEKQALAVQSPESSQQALSPMERFAFYQAHGPEQEPESTALPLSHYLWMLSRHKWRLLLFVGISVASAIAVASRLTPLYEATATIDVDRLAPSGVVGQESNAASRNMGAADTDTFLTTQMRLVTSDSVLRPVVQKLKLQPAAKNAKDAARDEAPVALGGLTVTRPPKTFLILISYRSPNRVLAADVANAVARAYIDRTFEIRLQASEKQSTFIAAQLEGLRAKMEGSSAKLLQFEKDLKIISPTEKTNILSARLLQLNTEWTNTQSDRLRKEAAAKSVHSGSVEALEASLQGEEIRKLAARVSEEAEKFATIKTTYGSNHPEYKKAAVRQAQVLEQFEAMKSTVASRVDAEYREAVDREKSLQEAVTSTKAEFDQLNSKSLEYQALQRDATADKTLYDELTRKVKEAGINAGFQGSSIRMADPARPNMTPVYPNVRMIAILAFFVSTIFGITVVFIAEGLDHSLRDPDVIQRQLQTEVLGALPVVKAWRGQLPNQGKKDGERREFFGSHSGIANTYEEAVRTLRDSILLPNADKRPRSLLLTSATPREGKTTTAVHLAVVHSQQKRRTLVIDCDLRRPGVYHHLGVSNDKGLSDVINDGANWRDLLITPSNLPFMQVLPAGPPSRRAADGIGDTLRHILAEAIQEYDLVVCDAPPLLGFAESLQIAALVDGVVVVALAGQTDRTAVASVISNLKRLRANVIGLTLNEVRADMSERYYYYGYYGKYYSRYYKPLSS